MDYGTKAACCSALAVTEEADMGSFDKDLDRGEQTEEVVAPDLPFDDDFEPGDRGITVRGPGQSVPKARAFTKYLPVGMCCQFVWNCIAAPHRFGLADANAAWARSKMRRTDQSPPPGAPVYWAGGKHGHIAISVGGGAVRSTDWPEKGSVGEVSISRMTSSWGITYRGWSADWAGVPIPGVGTAGTGATRRGRFRQARPHRRRGDPAGQAQRDGTALQRGAVEVHAIRLPRLAPEGLEERGR